MALLLCIEAHDMYYDCIIACCSSQSGAATALGRMFVVPLLKLVSYHSSIQLQ